MRALIEGGGDAVALAAPTSMFGQISPSANTAASGRQCWRKRSTAPGPSTGAIWWMTSAAPALAIMSADVSVCVVTSAWRSSRFLRRAEKTSSSRRDSPTLAPCSQSSGPGGRGVFVSAEAFADAIGALLAGLEALLDDPRRQWLEQARAEMIDRERRGHEPPCSIAASIRSAGLAADDWGGARGSSTAAGVMSCGRPASSSARAVASLSARSTRWRSSSLSMSFDVGIGGRDHDGAARERFREEQAIPGVEALGVGR